MSDYIRAVIVQVCMCNDCDLFTTLITDINYINHLFMFELIAGLVNKQQTDRQIWQHYIIHTQIRARTLQILSYLVIFKEFLTHWFFVYTLCMCVCERIVRRRTSVGAFVISRSNCNWQLNWFASDVPFNITIDEISYRSKSNSQKKPKCLT